MVPKRIRQQLGAAFFLAAIVVLVPAPARAQSCADQSAPANGAGALLKVITLERDGCLGGAADRSAISVTVRTALRPAISASAPPVNPYASALDLLLAHTAGPHTGGSPELFSQLATQIRATKDGLGTFKRPAVREFWRITQGRGEVVTGSLHERVTGACANSGPTCAAVFESVREATRIIILVQVTLEAESAPVVRAHVDDTTRRLSRWGHYFDSARSQYVWELKINSWLMKDTRPKDSNGVSQGFREVPNSQVMVLHPTVSFEFNKGAPDGQQLDPAVVVDVIGYNKWRWRDGDMGRALGASIIASIGDKASGNHVGWGAMFHVNHTYSFGFTIRPGSEKAFLLTADVAKLWTKVPQPVRERIAGKK